MNKDEKQVMEYLKEEKTASKTELRRELELQPVKLTKALKNLQKREMVNSVEKNGRKFYFLTDEEIVDVDELSLPE